MSGFIVGSGDLLGLPKWMTHTRTWCAGSTSTMVCTQHFRYASMCAWVGNCSQCLSKGGWCK